ncbi:hypothetical protein PR202_ga17566 [Eleusine coracana subsp. coracana]|uniref:Uncharacterized protein n=1 Tax=Eleusine coracana subsp. coracana TaxID=191504 RepID=A0AAV5CPT4_ELECO|nr:hypothetical protein PR202_ga17319 [Eleusine coracana subsp. coracana]GJN00387.1 hypothetical protein PR202_ga17566 [Eleusine coracana subsp. coracana]
MARSNIVAVPVILLVIMALLVISGMARPLDGDVWAPAGDAVSGEGVMQLLRQMYLQQLGAGPSCGTNSSNGGCPHHP